MSGSWNGPVAEPIPEIPEKPTWALFTKQASYQQAVRRKEALPVAYRQEDASLFTLPLDRTFCYLVTGREQSGKSTFLRNLIAAAGDMGAEIHIMDNEAQGDKALADLPGTDYASTPEELFALLKGLINLTNARGALRKQLREEGLENGEIWQRVAEKFPPVFYILPDLPDFMNRLYNDYATAKPNPSAEAGMKKLTKMGAHFDNIFNKGKLLNVFFIGAANVSALNTLTGRQAYNTFVRDRQGVILSTELGKQSLIPYQNIKYAEQSKRPKVGSGYASDFDGEQTVELIVVPNHKGGKGA